MIAVTATSEWAPGAAISSAPMSTTTAAGAVIGLALGIGVSLTTEIPLAPEGGLALGALVGWLWRRDPSPK